MTDTTDGVVHNEIQGFSMSSSVKFKASSIFKDFKQGCLFPAVNVHLYSTSTANHNPLMR